MSDWEKRERERVRWEATYHTMEGFVADMRNGCLKECFFLSEDVFVETIRMIQRDKTLAKEINDNGIIMLLKANKGAEIDGLVALAEVVVGEK